VVWGVVLGAAGAALMLRLYAASLLDVRTIGAGGYLLAAALTLCVGVLGLIHAGLRVVSVAPSECLRSD
jgi:hypothetical protein